ncbi:Transposon TX1 uncharacterized [Zancudomyces culisetae]|uniref:Transposon TX1 uncharacterized n=1 Tax=Zancudomyces culisetae TaxID=1213189 RepID=A0A1R1PY49_ZANCU|nr:Transposon TX1 uncharacterized [Zancudomyces culisetae]|eukprot:OMH85883.1 Transposon TX1 uncharacterized [Zancudomyces culisetae]
MDNILLKKFIIDGGRQKNNCIDGYVVMLDQEKAYDRVDWGYMYRCLTKMGIGTGFTRYLKAIYTGAKTRVKINGGLTEPMEITRGLRQGDPLSPLLYNIVIEPLLVYLRAMLKGLKTTGLKFRTSAYADDISVGISDKDDADILEMGLELHCKASNARVNRGKTLAISIGKPSAIDGFYSVLDKEANFRYLGITFNSYGINQKFMEDKLLSDIDAKVKILSKRHLSISGKVLLTNTLLLSKVWFSAQVIPFGKHFRDKLKRIVKNFIWNGKKSRIGI